MKYYGHTSNGDPIGYDSSAYVEEEEMTDIEDQFENYLRSQGRKVKTPK
jgi:hypothetical protein